MTRASVLLTLCSILAFGAACPGGDDDDGGGANCPASFMACGGDIAATWTLEGPCNEEPFTLPECPTATIMQNINQTGTVTFGSDMTYSANVNVTGTLMANIPASCLMGVTACDMLDDPEEGFDCSGDAATACDCTQTISDMSMETGTYVTSGNTVTITVAGQQAPQVLEYCVEGNTMTARVQGETAFFLLSK